MTFIRFKDYSWELGQNNTIVGVSNSEHRDLVGGIVHNLKPGVAPHVHCLGDLKLDWPDEVLSVG